MTYPITDRTYFTTSAEAWSFMEQIGNIQHGWIVSDFGLDSTKEEPFFVETMNDPFSSRDDLMRKAGMLAD